MLREEIRIRALRPHARAAHGAEGVGYAFLRERVGRHVVLAGVPGYLGF